LPGAELVAFNAVSVNSTINMNAVYEALETGLSEVVPGLVVLDRDLELAEDQLANLVGVDAHGHLTLVLVVEGDKEAAVIEILDALKFGRQNAGLLRRHLECRELNPDRAPRVVAVAERFDDAIIGRLVPLVGRELHLFEIRTLRSARGDRAYLTRVAGEEGELEVGSDSPEFFLASLPTDFVEVASTVIRRLERVDDEIDRAASKTQVLWRRDGELVARLGWSDGELSGFVTPDPDPMRLRASADVDPFVERVLERYWGDLSPRDEAPLEVATSAAPRLDEPLLTAEEMEAFRD